MILRPQRTKLVAVLPKLYPEFRKVALASDIVEVRNYDDESKQVLRSSS